MVNINKEIENVPRKFDEFKQDVRNILDYQLIIRTGMKFLPINFHIDALRFSMNKHRRQVW